MGRINPARTRIPSGIGQTRSSGRRGQFSSVQEYLSKLSGEKLLETIDKIMKFDYFKVAKENYGDNYWDKTGKDYGPLLLEYLTDGAYKAYPVYTPGNKSVRKTKSKDKFVPKNNDVKNQESTTPKLIGKKDKYGQRVMVAEVTKNGKTIQGYYQKGEFIEGKMKLNGKLQDIPPDGIAFA